MTYPVKSWLVLLGGLVLYVAGAYCLFRFQSLPGPDTFFGYGLGVPLAGVIVAWVFAWKQRLRLNGWIPFGLAATAGFVGPAFLVLWMIVQIWASI